MLRGALAVLRKDLRIEWRTRESLASMVVLGVLLVLVFNVALDPAPADAPRLAPSVLWAAFVFTGLLGVQRGFVLEREQDCLGGLLASPLDPASCSTLAALRDVCQSVDEASSTYVASLNADDLEEIVRYTNLQGEPQAYPRWQILLHQTLHATQHRSEAALLLSRLGFSTGWLDYLIHIDEMRAV